MGYFLSIFAVVFFITNVACPFLVASAKTDLAYFFGYFKLCWIMLCELGEDSVCIIDLSACFILLLGPLGEPIFGYRLIRRR